jgi:hypothetical protein
MRLSHSDPKPTSPRQAAALPKIAGALCIIAAVLAVTIARPGSAAKVASPNLAPARG